MKKLAQIAETGLGSYILPAIMGFFVGARFGRLSVLSRVEGLPRQRDVFYFFTSQSSIGSGMTGNIESAVAETFLFGEKSIDFYLII